MEKRELTCIVCPMSCRIEATIGGQGEVVSVAGNTCKRGERYARSEISNPVRTVTSTVKLEGGLYSRLPVITSQEVPKQKIGEVMAEINKVEVSAPVKINDVIIKNVCGLGVDILASRSMGKLEGKP